MLKRAISFAMAFMLLVFASAPVLADVAYTVEELEMTVSLPDEFITFTRDISEDDPNLEMFRSRAALLSQMEDGNIYLLSYSADNNDEITVVMVEDADSQEIYNLSRFTKGGIQKTAEKMASENEMIESYSVEEHGGVPFIKTETSGILEDSSVVFSTSYATVVNGRSIALSWSSYDGNMTDDEKEKMSAIISSVEFSRILSGGMLDYNQLIRNCIIAVLVVLVVVIVAAIVFKRKNPKSERPVYTTPVYEAPLAAEPALSDKEYTPQIAVHILDETFGYSLVNWDDAKEFADFVDETNTLYLHTFVDKNGKDKTEAMQYSAWMVLKREHDESHFSV